MHIVGKTGTAYASESRGRLPPESSPDRRPPPPQRAIVCAGHQLPKCGFQTFTSPDTVRKQGPEPALPQSHIPKNKTGHSERSLPGKGEWLSSVHHSWWTQELLGNLISFLVSVKK